jgi:hemerythrin superfamily protein
MTQQNQADVDLATAIRQDHELVKELFITCERGGDAGREAWEGLVRLLAVHETAEEEVLYPTVRGLGGEAEGAVKARLAEEDQAKKELSELEKMGPDAPEFHARFVEFRRAVLDHAEHEEREILPRLSQAGDADLVRKLASAFMFAKAVAPTHPHPHAPESAIGNMVLGPAVAIMDRARDAAREAMEKIRSGH